jgi:hypothetical protein
LFERSQPGRGSDALSGATRSGVLDCELQCSISSCDGRLPHLGTQQSLERLGQLTADVVVVVNEQSLEERQIELTPQSAIGGFVSGLAITDPCQGPLQVRFGLDKVGLNFSQTCLDLADGAPQSLLLNLQQIEWNGVGVVSL